MLYCIVLCIVYSHLYIVISYSVLHANTPLPCLPYMVMPMTFQRRRDDVTSRK